MISRLSRLTFLFFLASVASSQAQSFIRYIYPPNVISMYETPTQVVFTKPAIFPAGSSTQTTFGDGNSGAPSIAFASDLDTGFYRLGSNQIGVSQPLLLPDGTAVAPSLAWANGTNSGFYFPNPGIPFTCWSYGGTWSGCLRLQGMEIPASGSLEFSSSDTVGQVRDVKLFRDAANTLALRNGVGVPQTFNIYNTWTDAGNYERIAFKWNANNFYLNTEAVGTGTIRDISISGGTVFINGTQVLATGLVPSNAVHYLGSIAVPYLGARIAASIQGSKSKSLTDAAAAASFVRIAVPTNGFMGGKVIWTAQSTDGTDQRVSSAEQMFSGADKAGTVSCQVGAAWGTSTVSTNANTLVCTVSTVTSTTNCDLQATCTDNTAGSQTMSINYRLDMPIANTVAPQ